MDDERQRFWTTDHVADMLGLSDARVRQIARTMPAGSRHGRDWVFTDADVEAMRKRSTLRGRAGGPRKPLSEDHYNDLVERWNAMSQGYRIKAERLCKEKGHTYRETLIGEPDDPVYVCTRCLKYTTRKK
jgi:hypothetical protein